MKSATIQTRQLPDGSWQAWDENSFDGDPADIGRGPTKAEATADLRGVYGNTALDRAHYIATAYLRYRLINSPRCKAAQVESMARLMRRTVCLPFTTDQSVASRIARRFA